MDKKLQKTIKKRAKLIVRHFQATPETGLEW